MNKISGLNFHMDDIYRGLTNPVYEGLQSDGLWEDKEDRRKLLDMANFRKDEDFCIKNNSPISNWDVSNVINMEEMFCEADVFNKNINSWNTSKVRNMKKMF